MISPSELTEDSWRRWHAQDIDKCLRMHIRCALSDDRCLVTWGSCSMNNRARYEALWYDIPEWDAYIVLPSFEPPSPAQMEQVYEHVQLFIASEGL